MDRKSVAVVVIGRNEGARLRRCLRSIPAEVPTVYVDSGSTDGSVAFARSIGVAVLSLDMSIGFTAARARNVGWRHIVDDPAWDAEFIQFIDGDCELNADWIDKALAAMHAEAGVAAVFGRRRERFPGRSIYNRMCDDEWNVPVGIVAACGGDALFRVAALKAANGYSDDLIAGEEPDLCLRLARLDWFVRRIDGEMTLHDANILRFGSWWQRAKRGGFAYAAHVLRHGARSDPQWRRQLKSIVFWGFIWPLSGGIAAIMVALWNSLAGAMLFALLIAGYAVQIARVAARKQGGGFGWRFALCYGALIVIGKFAEFRGAMQCWISHILHRQNRLIEYKRPA
ncbi:MAG: glycosyltransferase [Sphingopyxis sp.]|uniref:glycosyltransferase n=1 Tax=Sphingopyxis sp. TaxID=1908224 RepID=UPI001A3C5DC8|nr:glycosyltransferase family 2 protein [Sphingopyxis sp.]MBL9067147.1 glycosyltransferase [Sphingopyxis sp.]